MLIDCFGTTDEFTALFSDRSVLRSMLRFEVALARAQAGMGMIPESAATAIAAVSPDNFDAEAIAREARSSASVAIPFVRAMKNEARSEFVHWGATSQDVMDTVLILLLVQARDILRRDHQLLAKALRALSEKHKDTVMVARTLMQPSSPITFGYKVASWYAGVSRSWRRLSQTFDDALRLQFGGASGTLAAYGDRGPELAATLAKELDLTPAVPWHTHRDRLAALVTDVGIYTGCIGKIARDVTLLMQFEVGEISESGGGSSAMPHKQNPSGSVVALAAWSRVPSLVETYLRSMVQEHERAAGAWQSEWQTVAELVSAAGNALASVAEVFESVKVYPERMRANLDATFDTVLSEKAAMLLTPQFGRDAAQHVAKAVKTSLERRQSLGDVLDVNLGNAEDYLGSSETFRRKLLEDTE
jgi:3-carboxy-cis,cis-muconate cycloisomerase